MAGETTTQPPVSGTDLLKSAKTEIQATPPVSTETAKAPETPAATPVTTAPPVVESTLPTATLTPELESKVDAFLRSTMQPIKTSATTKATTGTVKTVEELVEEGNTAEAVRQAAAEERNKAITQLKTEQEQQKWLDRRYQSNRKVYLNHPELLEVDSGTKKPSEVPFAQAMKAVYDEYTNLLEMPEGPTLAMELAEKRLGVKKEVASEVNQAKHEGAKTEAARQDQTRASAALASSSTGAAPQANAGEVVLSDSEKVVAGRLGLTEVDYGKFKGRKPMFDANYYSKHAGGPRPKR